MFKSKVLPTKSSTNRHSDTARGSYRVVTPLAIIVPNFIYITQYTRAQPSTKGADIFCPKQTFLFDKLGQSVILLTSLQQRRKNESVLRHNLQRWFNKSSPSPADPKLGNTTGGSRTLSLNAVSRHRYFGNLLNGHFLSLTFPTNQLYYLHQLNNRRK